MPTNTDNLGLVKINPATDGNDTFNVETHLNGNWDKIDADTVARQIENIGYGVQAGLETLASGTPDMNVHVQSGVVYMQSGKRAQFDAVTTIAVTAADGTNPRKDIVYVSSAGVITYLAGTAAATPAEPALPSGAFKLCVIDVPAADTAIEQAQITDSRILKDNLPAVKQQLVTHLADTAPHADATNLVKTDGSNAMTGNMNMSNNSIVNIGNLLIGWGSPIAKMLLSQNETTAYNGSATDGQLLAGATMFIQQRAGSNFAIAQIVFQPRDGHPYCRIVSSGGSAPFLAFVVNNAERMRINSDGTITYGTVKIVSGSGSPEGVITAPVGSLYLRTDGGAATTLYVKESGTGNAGWVAK